MRVLRKVKAAVLPWCAHAHIILVMDCAKIHVCAEVLDEARALGMCLVFVPAKTAWLLQPLDTNVFRRYKATLRRCYLDAKTTSDEGKLSTREWLLVLCKTIVKTMQGHPWARAVEEVGLTRKQEQVAKFVLGHFPESTPLPLVDRQPSQMALDFMFRRTGHCALAPWVICRWHCRHRPRQRKQSLIVWHCLCHYGASVRIPRSCRLSLEKHA